jgi:hypothetical protein
MKKNGKKKHVGKVKAKFPTSSILKKMDKDNFEKKHVGKHCNKTKTMWENIVTIHSTFLKKTNEAKSTKTILKKKRKKFIKKNHVGKHCSNL